MKRILGIAFFIGNTLLPVAFASIALEDGLSWENIFEAVFCILWLLGFFSFIIENQQIRDELNLLKKQKRNDKK